MSRLSENLIEWYSKSKRSLPWRDTQAPYPIWLSEIILQQTQVKQGLPYFNRFITAFPTIQALAEAPEEAVLKQWQGLGYYSRARNLHAAAKVVCERYGGDFPATYEAVRALPGIGDYTAAAILSFAFRQSYPVVDGNVLRVVSRIEGLTEAVDTPACRTKIKLFLEKQIDPERPDLFNQAMMEWGALLCLPGKAALCQKDPSLCFYHKYCRALQAGIVDILPVKKEKKAVRERFLHYYYKSNPTPADMASDPPTAVTTPAIGTPDAPSLPDGLYLRRRQADDIWKGLFDLPCIESDSPQAPVKGFNCIKRFTHLLTHQRLHLFFYKADTLPPEADTAGCFFVERAHWIDYAVPKVIEKFLDFLRNSVR